LNQNDIYEALKSSLVDALGIEEEDITPEATLLGNLGTESIDLLDILYKMDRRLGIKIHVSDIATYIQGDIPDEEFADEKEIISSAGLIQLKKVLPQINADELAGQLDANHILDLFTVQNLIDMYEERVQAAAS